jgi:5-methyltetrahydrofolate--homocysteine methyltransferase
VGDDFEKGKLFLPQMIQSAQAAQAGFEEIKNFLAAHPKSQGESFTLEQRGIVLATVHGDVHDIGKNIVKVILENYGFPVLDLGRDVPAEKVVEAVKAHHIRLVGLSALMTTTLKSMEETIAALRRENLPCKVMVGGAVLTEEYAKKIGADFYARDAKASADIAKAVLIGG